MQSGFTTAVEPGEADPSTAKASITITLEGTLEDWKEFTTAVQYGVKIFEAVGQGVQDLPFLGRIETEIAAAVGTQLGERYMGETPELNPVAVALVDALLDAGPIDTNSFEDAQGDRFVGRVA